MHACVFTSGRSSSYAGLDMMAGMCRLDILSRPFAASVMARGVPAGKKSQLFGPAHKATLM